MTKNMTTGNPFKLIMSFALPLLIGNLLQQMLLATQNPKNAKMRNNSELA